MRSSNFHSYCSLQAREASELSPTCDGQVKESAILESKEESTNRNNPVNSGGYHSGDTGIKIRTCLLPQQQLDSDNFGALGSVQRRSRLLMNTLPGSTVNDDVRDMKQSKEDSEAQSSLTEVRIPSNIKLESSIK